MEKETFLPIKGFDRYFVGNQGSIYSSVRATRFLTRWFSSHGYPMVSLMPTGASRAVKRFVHRLVAEAFVPNPDRLPTVNHRNGIKVDCDYRNLEWCSYGENNDHARRTGLALNFGATHYLAKFTDTDIEDIRQMASDGFYHRDIAKQYKVSRQTITKIVGRRAWRHLP